MAKKPTPTYYELLQHPDWQRMRLKIMGRADFACEHCEATDKPLSVHHSYYESKKKPWEYPEESLHCLCDACHREAQDLKTMLNRQLGKIDVRGDLERVYAYACGLEAMSFPDTVIKVASGEMASGVAAAWDLHESDVINALREGAIDGWTLEKLRIHARAERRAPRPGKR